MFTSSRPAPGSMQFYGTNIWTTHVKATGRRRPLISCLSSKVASQFHDLIVPNEGDLRRRHYEPQVLWGTRTLALSSIQS